jgi:hypothetical protein
MISRKAEGLMYIAEVRGVWIDLAIFYYKPVYAWARSSSQILSILLKNKEAWEGIRL